MRQHPGQALPYTQVTALSENQSLGWVTITHPFHPLRGKRLEVFSFSRKRDVFLLRDPSRQSKILLLRDWTDRADPGLYQSLSCSTPTLSVPHLLQLVDFLDVLNKAKSKSQKIKA